MLGMVPRHTMVSLPVLAATHRAAADVVARGVAGAIVECGVWNGGSAAILAGAALDAGDPRPVHLFDSFAGLPPPTAEDGAAVARQFFDGWCVGDAAEARRALAAVGQDPAATHVYEGWFEETFPEAETGPIAVLHIDADWYEPVRLALERFYPLLQPGGALLLNDYGRWPGCDRATDEYLGGLGLGPGALRPLARTGAVLIKP